MFFPMLSFRSFTVLHFTLKSVIHIEFIFWKGVRSVSRLMFLHVDVQLFQYCLLRNLSLTHCIAFASLAKTSQLYLWRTVSELHKIKRCLLLGRKAMKNLDNILKSRGIILLRKVLIVKAMFFPVVMYSWTIHELDHKESWMLKNWCRILNHGAEKTLESPFDSKKIKPDSSKRNQYWIFIGRTNVEAEASVL